MREMAADRYTVEIVQYQKGNSCRVSGKFCRNRGGRVSVAEQPGQQFVIHSIESRCSCYDLGGEVLVRNFMMKGTIPMGLRMVLGRLIGIVCVVLSVTGCASEFSVLGASGQPLLISRRGYSPDECTVKVKDDAARMGVTLRYVHIRGSAVGRSLLWPFEPGYACEAAIGPEQIPTGAYPNSAGVLFRGS
jgi:hypothetical protein